MTTHKDKFLEFIGKTGKKVLAAIVELIEHDAEAPLAVSVLQHEYDWLGYNHLAELPTNHTPEQELKFLNDLAGLKFDGTNMIEGFIWFVDGSWASLEEDVLWGEYWLLHEAPVILDRLKQP